MEHSVSPKKRGSRPTITRAPAGFCDTTYRAIPPTARRTLAKVNSSPMTARHPDVPNLIVVMLMPFDFALNVSGEGPLPSGDSI